MLKSIGTAWLVLGANAAATIFLLPAFLRGLGQERYGAWILVSTVIGYLGLLSLGVPMSSVREFSKALEGDVRVLRDTVKTVLWLYVLLGFLSVVLLVAFLIVFRRTYGASLPDPTEAYLAFAIAGLQFPLSFLAQAPSALLAAMGRIPLRNLAALAAVVVRIVGALVVLRFAPSVTAIAAVQVLAALTELVVLVVSTRDLLDLRAMASARVDRALARRILSVSIYVLIFTFGLQVCMQADPIIIGRALDVGLIPAYSIPSSVFITALQLVVGIASVVMPTVARLQARQEHEAIAELIARWWRVSTGIALTLLIGCSTLGEALFSTWIGSDHSPESVSVLVLLSAAGVLFMPARGVTTPALMGLGQERFVAAAYLAAAAINIAISFALVRPLGLVGVACGTLFSTIGLSVVLGSRLSRIGAVAMGNLVRSAMPGQALAAVVASVLGAAPFALLPPVRGVVPLAGSAMFVGGVCLASWYALAMSSAERAEVRAIARRTLART